MKKIMFKITSLLLAMSMAACSSTTAIRTTDKEARIFVDGEYRGKGEVTHSDTKIIGSKTEVRIEKKGCQPQTHTFARNEEFDVGACVGGIFLLVPFLWIQKYKPERTYEFNCEKN